MTTDEKPPMPLAERIEYVIDHLDVFQETRNPCKNGHVEHTAEDHLGRRTVHTMSLGSGLALGADWDVDEAIAFIRRATKIKRARISMGHPFVVMADDRIIAFAGREPERK